MTNVIVSILHLNYRFERIAGASAVCKTFNNDRFLCTRQRDQINVLHFQWKRMPAALAQTFMECIEFVGYAFAKLTVDKKTYECCERLRHYVYHLHDIRIARLLEW